MKNVLKPFEKSVLIPLGLTAVASAADVGIHQKVLGPGTTALIISKELKGILKIVKAPVKSLKDSVWLIKGVTQIENKTKK